MVTKKLPPKATRRATAPRSAPTEPPTLLSFDLNGSGVLGQLTHLDLSRHRTLLVGRNGAGKSAIFDAILYGARAAIGLLVPDKSEMAVPSFRCRFQIGKERFAYEYSWTLQPTASAEAPVGDSVEWSENCRSESGDLIWSVKHGRATIGVGGSVLGPAGTEILIPPGRGMLALASNAPVVLQALSGVLRTIERVRAGVPRSDDRQFVYGERKRGSRGWTLPPSRPSRLHHVSVALLNWAEDMPDVFGEFVKVGQRLRLWSTVRSQTAPLSDESELGVILVDGQPLGYLSDGTLRIVELLRYVLSPVTRFLLVEEPETGLHPGLQSRLLAELEAYSLDHQWIASTHAPLVVAKVQPEEIRLVTRETGKTSVRALDSAAMSRVDEFLTNDGTLGEWVFGGGADA